MLLLIIFALLFFISAAGGTDMPSSLLVLERDLRAVQAIVFLILFAVVGYYAIPMGKNVRGIAIGYVFGIATALLNLGLRYYFGESFDRIWRYDRPIAYLAALTIWGVTLWAYQRDPTPPQEDIERDYEWVSGQAVQAMVRLRAHLIHPDGS
jgi:hypothetical protein